MSAADVEKFYCWSGVTCLLLMLSSFSVGQV